MVLKGNFLAVFTPCGEGSNSTKIFFAENLHTEYFDGAVNSFLMLFWPQKFFVTVWGYFNSQNVNPTSHGPFAWRPDMGGGPERPPQFFLGNYILYGVLVFIFMYIPINHVCMAIFRLHRFPPAALWRQNWLHKQRAIVSVKMVGWTWKLVSILVLMPKI